MTIRTLLLGILTFGICSIGQARAEAAPEPPSLAIVCGPPEASEPAAFAGKRLSETLAALRAIERACDGAVSDARDHINAASLPALEAAIEAVAKDAQTRALSSCQQANSAPCAFDNRVAMRTRTAFASAKALVLAYSDLATTHAPPEIIDADELVVERHDLAAPLGFQDIVVGATANGGAPQTLPLSLCTFVFSGELNGDMCGLSTPAPTAGAWNIVCDAACAARAAAAAKALPTLHATSALYQKIVAATVITVEHAKDVRVEAMWNAYWFAEDQGRVQWPWEMLVNGAFYKPEQHKDDGGRFIPPNSSIVALHPSAAMSFFDDDGDKVSFGGVVEVVGYSRWDYDGKTGARDNEWGASLIAAYNQSDTADDWGYGVLVRTPYRGLNVAWVRRDGRDGDEDAILFSVSLNDLARSTLNADKLCARFGVDVAGICKRAP